MLTNSKIYSARCITEAGTLIVTYGTMPFGEIQGYFLKKRKGRSRIGVAKPPIPVLGNRRQIGYNPTEYQFLWRFGNM